MVEKIDDPKDMKNGRSESAIEQMPPEMPFRPGGQTNQEKLITKE